MQQVRDLLPKVLGFDYVSVFFKDGPSLFTLTQQERREKEEDDSKINVDFAQELFFGEEEIVMFPGYLGVTGECSEKCSFRVENEIGLTKTKKTLKLE